MTRSYVEVLAAATMCLLVASCGGGEESGTFSGGVSPSERTLAVGSEALQADSEAEFAAWEQRAAINRSEVEQVDGLDTSAVHEGPRKSVSESQTFAKAITAPAAPLYRFFNIETGAHLFTKNVSERDTVLNTLPQFRYEGPVFSAWNATSAGLAPVYRFYNTRSGAHFYTISESEKNNLLATAPWMNLDGVAYFASPTAQAGTTPLYRFFHRQRGFHFYTASSAERDSIVANLPTVYQYEGVGYHVNSQVGSYSRALASLAGKANTLGHLNAQGESARFRELRGMAFNPAGDLFVVDMRNTYGSSPELRRISPAGLVTSFVGNHDGYYSYADGVGSGAAMYNMRSVTFDSAGMGFVGDSRSIRSITPEGLVTTIAGSLAGQGYVNGQAQAARFNDIDGIAKDSVGNIYVSDSDNQAIRKLAPTGIVSTFAGAAPETSSGRAGYADGLGTAARFYSPGQIGVDASDNVYVADYANNRIRKITPAGLVTTLAGQGTAGVVDGQGSAAQFDHPFALAVDKATGNVYTADYRGYTVRRITPSGEVTTVVGTPYSPGVFFGALPAGLDSVGGLAIRGNRLYIASNSGVYWTHLPQ